MSLRLAYVTNGLAATPARRRARPARRHRLRRRRADARPPPPRPVRAAISPPGRARLRARLEELGLAVRRRDRRALRARPAPQARADAGLRRAASGASTCCRARGRRRGRAAAPTVVSHLVRCRAGGHDAGQRPGSGSWTACDGVLDAGRRRRTSSLGFEPEPGMLVETARPTSTRCSTSGSGAPSARPHARHRPLRLPRGRVRRRTASDAAAPTARARPRRGHAPRRPRAPGRSARASSTSPSRSRRSTRSATPGWSRSSSPATATPRTSRAARDPRPAGGGATEVPVAHDRRRGALGAARRAGRRPSRLRWLRGGRARPCWPPTRPRSAPCFPDVGPARSGRGRSTRAPTRPTSTPGRVDDAARTLLLVALGARSAGGARRAVPLRRRGRAARRAARAPVPADRRSPASALVDDAMRTNDTRPDRRRARAVRRRAPRTTTRLRQAVLKCVFIGVPITRASTGSRRARHAATAARMLAAFVHERVAAGRDRPGRGLDRSSTAIRRRTSSPRSSRRARPAVRRSPRGRPSARWPSASSQGASMRIFDPHVHMTSRTTDDYEAMAALGREGARRARVLARPAAHARSASFVDYFDVAARLGALPRRAVRHPPPLHDRAQPEGGERRPRCARGARRRCRATWPRTASSPSARSASTR